MTTWTVACQPPLSMGFPRQEQWSGLPFPTSRDCPDVRTETVSAATAGRLFTIESPGESSGLISQQRPKSLEAQSVHH